MKVLKKTNIVQKMKTAEHTKTERQVSILILVLLFKLCMKRGTFTNKFQADIVVTPSFML